MSILRLMLVAVIAVSVVVTGARAQSFDANGVKIRYAVEGKGEPVVLVHGLYSSGWINWTLTGVTKELAKDHKVIILDLAGHGLSDRPAKKEAYGEQLADDVVLLLDHLKIKKAHIVGYSLGGMVTMKVLAKHPDRVISGTVAGMGWFQSGSLPQKILKGFKGGKIGPPQEFFDAIGGLGLTEAEVKKIKVPVKIIVGDNDICKRLYVEPLQKVRKDWSVAEIPDGDHFTALIRPQFKEEIGAWVRKNKQQYDNGMLEPLPIDAVLPELVAKLRERPAVVLRAPTGAGKTTRVPPTLLDARFTSGRIVVLEPRRLAARAAARRMAHERGQRVGDDIGYHVRFDRQAGPGTRVFVMTPGILLRMLHDDPFLESVGVVVFDEFHERALDNDLALGMVRLLQTTVRPDLRIVVMSATLATGAISTYLGDCPIVTSEGRLHPVDLTYEPRSLQQPWPVAAARAIERVLTRTDGDVLCFLPGMQEIRQTMRELGDLPELVLPLHGDLSPQEQDRALLPQERRRIVLATNVAETSVTVEGVTAVVDTGLARMQIFDAAVGMDRLELTPIARDAADQRAGRAGRTRPGVCVRLWTEASHAQRPAQTLPEIARVDLAGAVLHLLGLGETDLARFPWLEPPRPEAIDQAMTLLRRLGAVPHPHPQPLSQGARGESLTDLGRAMARLPVHPRLARMLIEGQRLNAAPRVALAAALLSERDPFARGGSALPRKRRAGSYSDVLARVEALEAHERDGTTSFAVGTLEAGAARFLLRARDQLLRTLRDEQVTLSPGHPVALSSDDAVLRSLLVAFPDRVARRRDADPSKGLMVGGVGVRLAPWCGVSASELFLCIDVDADPKETLVRQASSIEREWLPVAARVETYFDETSERLSARKRVYYEDLLIEESDAALPRSEEASRLLAEAAATRLPRVLPAADSAAGSFLVRLRWLRAWMPELGLPAFGDDELRELVPWACAGCRTFDEVRRADWLGLMQEKLTSAQVQAIEREAPERLQVPSGNSHKLAYEVGRAPVLAVRIQEVFGLKDTPRLAGGRVRVLLHLLAPNQRPQQVTDDLASFWNNTYQQVRKDLRARYPKHAWPEDPWNAPAQKGPKRKPR